MSQGMHEGAPVPTNLAPVVVFNLRQGFAIPGVSLKKHSGAKLSADSLQSLVREVEAVGRYQFVQLLFATPDTFLVLRDQHAEVSA